METFYIRDYINEAGDIRAAGMLLYKDVLPFIEKNEKVILDFEGAVGVPTLFLNTSLGDLMDVFGIERVKKAFKFTNVLISQADRIKKYFLDYEAIKTGNS